MTDEPIHIVGGGLAGSEAAWQAAEAGARVVLHEMRPVRGTDAHQTDSLAELVCSNSFRSDDFEHNAVGLLHAVAGSANDLDLDCVTEVTQLCGDVVGLPKGELRAARADADRFGHVCSKNTAGSGESSIELT